MEQCWWCKKSIKDGEPWLLVNVAPHAAGGGVSMPHHTACSPFTLQMVPNANRPPRAL